jgi:hypothetical protein
MTPDQFVKVLRDGSREFRGAQDTAVKAAAEAVQRSALRQAEFATHGSMVLRGAKVKEGSAPKPLSVKMFKGSEPATWIVKGDPWSQWSWLERGTKAHVIGTGKRGGKEVRRLANGNAQVLKKTRRKNKQTGQYELVESLQVVKHNGEGKPPWLMVVSGNPRSGPWKIRDTKALHTFSNGVNQVDAGAIMNRVMQQQMFGKMFR